MNSIGGSDLQYALLMKYVHLEKDVVIHRIPNPEASSIYHINEKVNQYKKNVLWTQQSYDMIESFSAKHYYEQMDKLVFVSSWQERKYVEHTKIPTHKNVIIENGIEPITDHDKPTSIINLIYMATPYRGLDVLLEAIQYIQHLNIHLHVFSSMKIYGQDSEDKNYEHLYNICRKHPKITYHGSVSHETIRTALQESHILAYPSTFEETSCVSVIEAMSAQCAVVCPDLGALSETANGFAVLYPFECNKLKHASLFAKHLLYSIENYNQMNHKKQKGFFDAKYSWVDTIKNKWVELLTNIYKQPMNITAGFDYT